MHRTTIILTLLLSTSLTAYTDDTRRYGFEQARIVLEKTTKNTSLESTTIDTVYLDEWGGVEVRHSHEKQNIRMIGKTAESRSVSIMEAEWLTTYDPVERKGSKMKNPFFQSVGNLSDQQKKEMGEGMAKAFKATTASKGTEEIAGRPCEVTETKTGLEGMESVTTMWKWKGFIMKSVTNSGGTEITESVLSIDEGIGVDPALLKVPDDVHLTGPRQ
jgi:hypothetical protein